MGAVRDNAWKRRGGEIGFCFERLTVAIKKNRLEKGEKEKQLQALFSLHPVPL